MVGPQGGEARIGTPVDAATEELFGRFLSSEDTLRVYEAERLVFSSSEGRLAPLLEYVRRFGGQHRDVKIMDRVTGNAAGLLCVKAGGAEVRSELGSVLAATMLTAHGVRHHFKRTVASIQGRDGQAMCPMELLSLHKSPDELYALLMAGGCQQPPRP